MQEGRVCVPDLLLDLFNLLNLPPQLRLAMQQVLRLLPRVSQVVGSGSAQTYAMANGPVVADGVYLERLSPAGEGEVEVRLQNTNELLIDSVSEVNVAALEGSPVTRTFTITNTDPTATMTIPTHQSKPDLGLMREVTFKLIQS